MSVFCVPPVRVREIAELCDSKREEKEGPRAEVGYLYARARD